LARFWLSSGLTTANKKEEFIGKYSQISSGGSNVCGLKLNNYIECHGRGFYKRYYDEDAEENPVNCLSECGQSRPPDYQFISVSAGDVFTCGMKKDKTILCWGNPVGKNEFSAGGFLP